MVKKKVLAGLATAVVSAALVFTGASAAQAVVYTHMYGFTTLASCQAEQGKAAYNNSWVRVYKPCYVDNVTHDHGNYAFDIAAIG